jgi:hypothetical protein
MSICSVAIALTQQEQKKDDNNRLCTKFAQHKTQGIKDIISFALHTRTTIDN